MPRIIDCLWGRQGLMGLVGLISLVGLGWAATPTQVLVDQAGQSKVQSALIGSVSAVEWADGAPADWVSDTTLRWESNAAYTVITWTLSDPRLAERFVELPVRVIQEDRTTQQVFVVDPKAQVVGPVSSGTTLWRIAEAWRASLGNQPPSMQTLIDVLIEANPQAFERDDPASLLAGAMLRLPNLKTAMGDDALPDPASRSVDRVNQTQTLIPVPWRSIGTKTWIETTMVRALVDGRTQNQVRSGARLITEQTAQSLNPERQPQFDLADRIQGQWVFLVFVVVAVMLMLHGFSRIGVIEAGRPQAQTRTAITLSPEAVATTMSLAEHYLRLGDPAQALHWLEEVMAFGDAKQVRSAKKLWREAQALFDREASQ